MRQKSIDNYILDFYYPEKKIGIEIGGSQHYTEEGKEYDRIQTNILNTYKIEIRRNFRSAFEYIDHIIKNTENRKEI